MPYKLLLRISLLAVCLLPWSSTLQAGKITDFVWSDGIVSIAGIVPPIDVDENNDDVAGDNPNELRILQKDYKGTTYIDIEFTVMDTGGVTEYAVIEGVQNSTTDDWGSYHVQLGYGTGDDFVLATSGDGLDFDAPLYNSPTQFDPGPLFSFPVVAMSENQLDADGGPGQLSGQYNEPFVFHIDVPDGIETFTLRQFPLPARPVPEPTSLVPIICTVAMAVLRIRWVST